MLIDDEIKKLCAQVAAEQDTEELLKLVRRLNEALQERQRQKNSSWADDGWFGDTRKK